MGEWASWHVNDTIYLSYIIKLDVITDIRVPPNVEPPSTLFLIVVKWGGGARPKAKPGQLQYVANILKYDCLYNNYKMFL